MRPIALLAPLSLLVPAGCAEDDATPVRATLSDGQILAGSLRTDTLFLESALGTLPIPLADVGEVLPVEGGELEGSGGYVTVWLRNGSEFRGRWADPELNVELTVGGEVLDVELPVEDLTRFQLQGGEIWPDQPVFRVRTHSGDDFLVDADDSRVVLESRLGTFSPWLSECTAIVATDHGWQVYLQNGSVLVGDIKGDDLDFRLSVGPDAVSVPVSSIASMHWEAWGSSGGSYRNVPMSTPEAAAPAAAEELEFAPARRSQDAGDGWFSNQRLYDAKH